MTRRSITDARNGRHRILKALRNSGDTTPPVHIFTQRAGEVVIEAFVEGADFYPRKAVNQKHSLSNWCTNPIGGQP